MKKLLLLIVAVLCAVAVSAESQSISFDINTTTLGKTNTSYVTTAFDFTVGDNTFTINNITPSTGQARGNQSAATGNFFIYNKTAITNISSIELTYSGTIATGNIYFSTGDAPCSSAITTGITGSTTNNVLKIEAADLDKSYFRLQFVNKATSGTVKVTKLVINYETGTVSTKQPAGIEYTTPEFKVELGDEFTAPELVNPNGLEVEYTSSNPAVATVDAEGAVQLLASGTTTITATSIETEEFRVGEASYKIIVSEPLPEGMVMDELTAANFNMASGGSYSDYTYVSPVTNIEYKAQAYSESGVHFQLRTKESKSGIVVTKNDEKYIIREIRAEWTTNGTDDKKVNVYVNDKAYTAPSQLHSITTQGTLAGSIVKGENLPVKIDEDACFVGLRSNDGSIQLHAIYVIWEKAPAKPAVPEVVVNEGDNTVTVTVDEGCTAYYKYAVVAGEEAPEAFDLEAETWYPVENNTIDLTQLPRTTGSEKIELTVKAVNAEGAESDVHTSTFANPGGVSGIADVELGEAAEAVYYNMQGVRMNGDLAPGLYIRRQGDKATKIIVK